MLHPHRENRAVVVEGDRHLRFLGARMRRRDKILVAILGPLHRASEQARRKREGGLFASDVDLLAERAADVGHDHVHLRRGHAQEPGEVIPRAVRALARDPDRHVAPTGIPACDDAPGLHRHRDVAVLADRVSDHVGRDLERKTELRVVG